MEVSTEVAGGAGTAVLENARPDPGNPETYNLVALDTTQLREAHAGMLQWARNAQDLVNGEIEHERENLEAAIAAGFKTAPFENRIHRLERRLVFYGKIEEALKQGYVLVPNFRMNTFAIRTKAKTPRGTQRDGRWHPQQEPQILAEGEGEWRNPTPLIETSTETRKLVTGKEGQTYEQVVSWPSDFQEEIDFPLAIAKPQLMQRTATVMARKLFDEIGVAVDASVGGGGGDPILLGRIRNPRSGRPAVTFFLGWYFDPSRL